MWNSTSEIDSFALKFIYPVSFGFMKGIIINSWPIFRTIDFSIYLFVCQVDTGIILIALCVFIHWQKRFISTFSVFVSWLTHLLVNYLHWLLSIGLYLNRFLLYLINIDRLWSLFIVLCSIHWRLHCSLALRLFYFFSYLYLCSLVIRICHTTSFYSSEISRGLGLGGPGLETRTSTA